jgi:glycosyltransferase involved in cell wall biosynthesis
MAKSNPKISIVIPVYNAERYLRACLESVVRQTISNIEIIAIDDGSSDRCPMLLGEYRDIYPDRVKVFTTENHGANRARNEALKHVTGEFVLFVDSDDFIEPDMCEKLHAKANRDNDDIVFCAAYNVYEDPNTGQVTKEPASTLLGNQDFSLLDKKCEFIHISPFPWAKLFRRWILNDLEFPELTSFRGNNGQFSDLVLVFQACCKAHKIGVIEEPLYNYRRTTVGELSWRTLDVVQAFRLLVEYMKTNGYWDAFHDELEYVCTLHFIHRYPRLFKLRGGLAIKLEFIDETYSFLNREFPNWRRNKYLHRSSSALKSLLRLYTNKSKMLRLVRVREYTPDFVARLLTRQIDRINVFAERP